MATKKGYSGLNMGPRGVFGQIISHFLLAGPHFVFGRVFKFSPKRLLDSLELRQAKDRQTKVKNAFGPLMIGGYHVVSSQDQIVG